jgi:hypothetical protein
LLRICLLTAYSTQKKEKIVGQVDFWFWNSSDYKVMEHQLLHYFFMINNEIL